MNRRKFIVLIGSGSAIGLSGCTSKEQDKSPVKLLSVTGLNQTDAVETLHTRVNVNGDTLKEETCILEPDEECVLDCSWPVKPKTFTVAARLESDDEWTESDLTELNADCASVVAMIRADGVIDLPIVSDCDPAGESC